MPWIPRDIIPGPDNPDGYRKGVEYFGDIIPGPDNPDGYRKGVEYFDRLCRKEPSGLLCGLVTAALIGGLVIGYFIEI